MKKGISLVSLVIVIIVMIILAGIVVVTGFNSAENATINTFALEILNIQTAVDEYYFRYEKYPVADEYVLDITNIPSESLEQFEDEAKTNNKITFKVLELSLIGITDTEFGKGEDTDFYILSETTGKVYYLKGVEYDGITYYTLTDELKKSLNIKLNDVLYTNDIKVQDVIFSPSEIDYTNIPVTVQVKLPLDATIISVAAEGKSVSAETTNGMYKVFTVNETTADKTGNYTTTVNYEYEGVAKTAEYAVTNFDNIAPTLSVIETEEENVKTISINATDTGSGTEEIKYAKEIVIDKTYFKNQGLNVNNNEVRLGNDEWYTIYVEDKAGNVTMYNNMPEDWKTNVVDIADDVPIPKGFVASSVAGENTKVGGLVIYEGTDVVTSTNVDNARRNRNQYVWVPIDSNKFDSVFIRRDYMNDTSKVVDTDGNYYALGTSAKYWEVIPTTELNDKNLKFMTKETLEEVQAMYASVKKYGGFYIARYEAGIDAQRREQGTEEELPGIKEGVKVYSQMGKIPYNFIPLTWNSAANEDEGGAMEISRKMYPATNINYGVVSTLTYGVQWDTTVQWLIDTKAMTLSQSTAEVGSSQFGNYKDHIISTADDLNDNALVWDYSGSTSGSYVDKKSETLTYPKTSNEKWLLTTGALKDAQINSIYDMAGNLLEWTMEGYAASVYRSTRGGGFYIEGKDTPIGYRYVYSMNKIYNGNIGFRPSLYIKIS